MSEGVMDKDVITPNSLPREYKYDDNISKEDVSRKIDDDDANVGNDDDVESTSTVIPNKPVPAVKSVTRQPAPEQAEVDEESEVNHYQRLMDARVVCQQIIDQMAADDLSSLDGMARLKELWLEKGIQPNDPVYLLVEVLGMQEGRNRELVLGMADMITVHGEILASHAMPKQNTRYGRNLEVNIKAILNSQRKILRNLNPSPAGEPTDKRNQVDEFADLDEEDPKEGVKPESVGKDTPLWIIAVSYAIATVLGVMVGATLLS